MLEPHQRAALIPTEPGMQWHAFLQSRFVEAQPSSRKAPVLAIVIQAVQQQSPIVADIRGLTELILGSALPLTTAFVGQINLDSREFSVRQSQPEKVFSGQFSENGLVMVLREVGQARQMHLVHEATLAQLV